MSCGPECGRDDAKMRRDATREMDRDPWAHRSEGMSCGTCMWFVLKESSGPHPPGDRRAVGRCRRRAPTISGYPVVFKVDWCGEHKLDENKA